MNRPASLAICKGWAGVSPACSAEFVVSNVLRFGLDCGSAFGLGRPLGSVEKTDDCARIVLDKKYPPGLLGLEGFSHIDVFWWFDQNDSPEKRAVLQVHPRGDPQNPLTGVFATRSPVRPLLPGHPEPLLRLRPIE